MKFLTFFRRDGRIIFCALWMLPGMSLFPEKAWTQIDYNKLEQESASELVIQSGHSDYITKLSVTSDGRLLFSGANDGLTKVWTFDGQLIKTIDEDFQGLSSDDRFMISSSSLRGTEGKMITKIGSSRLLCVSGDGKLIFGTKMDAKKYGNYDWDYNSTHTIYTSEGNILTTFSDPGGGISCATFNRQGTYIVASCFTHRPSASVGPYEYFIKIWDAGGRLVRTIRGPNDDVMAVKLTEDQQFIVGGYENKIAIWTFDGVLVRTIEAEDHWVKDVCITADGRFIISASSDNTARVWTWDGKPVRTLQHQLDVTAVAVSPTREFIFTGSDDHAIRIWTWDGTLVRTMSGQGEWIRSVAMSRDKSFVASIADNGTVKIWDANGGLRAVHPAEASYAEGIEISPDGRFVISSANGKLQSWLASGAPYKSLGNYGHFCISHNGKHLIAASGSIRILTIEGELEREIPERDPEIHDISISQDNKYIVALGREHIQSSKYFVRILDFEGNLLRSMGPVENLRTVAISPDGQRIYGYADDVGTLSLYVWTIGGDLIKKLTGTNIPSGQLTFTPKGNLVARLEDTKIGIWDKDLRLMRTLASDNDFLTTIALSEDGKNIITGSRYGTVRIWNLETGDYVSYRSSDSDWIIYTPDGYFDASKNGGRLVTMAKGLTGYGLDQFAVRNNRPDVILKRLGLGSNEYIQHLEQQYRKRLRKLGLSEERLSSELHVPVVNLLDKRQDGKRLTLTFKISDSKYPLKTFNVYINDVPLFGAYGKTASGFAQTVSESFELTTGANKIEITCINDRGAESFRALTFAEYGITAKANLYFIGFGVSKYQNPNLNLQYADKDVLDLAGVLSKMKGSFNNIYTHIFINEQVTVENIRKSKELLKNAKPDDTFILFIAGHGMHDKDKETTYYYLTHAADPNNLKNTAADFETIEDLLQGIAPRNKLFLMDACESGEIDDEVQTSFVTQAGSQGLKSRGMKTVKTETAEIQKPAAKRSYLFQRNRYIYNDLVRRSGTIVYSSSKGGELSYESSDMQNGLFTQSILKAITSTLADKNNDGIVSTDELRDFVSAEVALASGDLQHPTVDRDNIYQKFGFSIVK